MIFEKFTIQPCSQNSVNGVTYFNHKPLEIEGKGMFVKLVEVTTDLSIGGEELLKTPLSTNEAWYTVPKCQAQHFPQDTFLEAGEKLVLTTFGSYSTSFVVIHYNKQPKQESQAQGFTISLSGETTPK